MNQFWREVAGKGPLLESVEGNDQDLLVTFLWRETFETHNVLAGWPMASFSRGGLLHESVAQHRRVVQDDTDSTREPILVLALPERSAGKTSCLPRRLDPLNPRLFPDDPGSLGQDLNSVLDTPGAPDETWFRQHPRKAWHRRAEDIHIRPAENVRDIWVYTPPGYSATAGPYPLVVLFDGYSHMPAPPGTMRPRRWTI